MGTSEGPSSQPPRILLVDMLSSNFRSATGAYGVRLLKTYLEAAGIKTGVSRCSLDETRSKTHREFASGLTASGPAVIGFSAFACNYLDCLLVARAVKELSPGTLVLMGGPQASATAEETLKAFPFVDVIARGESDASVADLAGRLISGARGLEGIPGVVYRGHAGGIISNPPPAEPFPLEKIPFVPAGAGAGRGPLVITMEAGRGCGSRCSYCPTSLFWGRRTARMLPVSAVLERMRAHLSGAAGRRVVFSFINDNLAQDAAWLDEFLRGMPALLRDHPGTSWELYSRPDSFSAATAGRLAAAGCSSVFLGLESGSPSISRKIGKVFDPEKIFAAAEVLNSQRLNLDVSFILGFPGESAAEINATLSLALRLRLIGAHPALHVLAVMPETAVAASARLEFLRLYSNFATYPGNLLSIFKADNAELEELIAAHPGIFPFHHSVANLDGIDPAACRFLENYGNLFLWFLPASLLLLSRATGLTLFEVMEGVRQGGAWREAPFSETAEGVLELFSRCGEKLLAGRGAGGGWLAGFARYETLARGAKKGSLLPRILARFPAGADLQAFEESLAAAVSSGAPVLDEVRAGRPVLERTAFLLWVFGKPALYIKAGAGEKLGFADLFRIAWAGLRAGRGKGWVRQYPGRWSRAF